jgi:hypothetical protein
MARSLRFQRVPAQHRDRCKGSKDTPPVWQINSHRSFRRSQKASGHRVVRQRDASEPCARLLRHAELCPPAEQESRDDSLLAGNAGDRRTRLPVSITIASFCSSLKKRRAGVVGAREAPFAVLSSFGGRFLSTTANDGPGRGVKMRTPVDFNLAVVQPVTPFAQHVGRQRLR